MGVGLILEIGVGELETWQEIDANISMRLGTFGSVEIGVCRRDTWQEQIKEDDAHPHPD